MKGIRADSPIVDRRLHARYDCKAFADDERWPSDGACDMRFERASKKRELSLKTDVKQFCKMLCLVAAQRLRLRSARLLLPQLLLLRSLQNTRRCFAINDEATTAASASATSRLPHNNNNNNSSNVVRSQHYKQKLQTGCVVSSKTNKAKAEDPLSLPQSLSVSLTVLHTV